jgi:phenylacetate-CoA ligase
MNALPEEIHSQLLRAFRRAAEAVPAYRELCREQGVRAERIVDVESFSRHCPLLARSNTFDRFPIDRLCHGGDPGDLAQVLTSSGHGGGGNFSFGLTSRKQAALNEHFIDLAMDEAFRVKTRKTLTVNCLPMGVVFSSQCMTVANTSVREDMAVALVRAFGGYYDQIILVCDPLFMNRLAGHAAEKSLDWARYRVNAVIGEEIFGERYRSYLEGRLGLGEGQWIMASLGVAELGLNLCFETPATIALRRAASADPGFARDLFGIDPSRMVLPMLYSFHPQRIFVESVAPDADGYGQMTVSMLDTGLTVPLLRYQTGDAIRLPRPGEVAEAARRHGIPLPAGLPHALLALKGREKESLPNRSHVGVYKDALYADGEAAAHLTGAFRLVFSGDRCDLHVQLNGPAMPDAPLGQAIRRAIPAPVRPEKLVLWPYGEFPFGMGLDYERKFTYYVPEGAGPSVP